jgi:hypothetical protein
LAPFEFASTYPHASILVLADRVTAIVGIFVALQLLLNPIVFIRNVFPAKQPRFVALMRSKADTNAVPVIAAFFGTRLFLGCLATLASFNLYSCLTSL